MKKLDVKGERRQLRKSSVLSLVRSRLQRARELIAQGEKAEEAVVEASSALDRAASKGLIHPNKASRLKSRLMKKFHQAKASSASS